METPDSLAVALTLADLFALMASIGILCCRLWVLAGPGAPEPGLLGSLWRLLGACLAVLAAASAGDLVHRSLTMSGQPAAELLSVLPTVWTQTHYGRVWLVRLLALGFLWFGWGLGGRLRSRPLAALMLAAAAAVALCRSLSGHAADWGGSALPPWIDWLHLLAASAWGGALLALVLAGFQAFTAQTDRAIALARIRRLSSLSGVALAVVLVTGIWNAWLEVGSLPALWQTAYGIVLLAKLGLAFCIVMLGAANRYVGIPRLRQEADPGAGPASWGPLARILALLTDWMGPGVAGPWARFSRKLRVETALMAGLVVCVAVLVNLTPARHLKHPEGAMHHHSALPAPNPAGLPLPSCTRG